MSIKQLVVSSVLAGVMLINITACKKYSEGPSVSLLTKKERMSNTWKINKYYEDGIDITSSLSKLDLTIDMTKNGKLIWTEVDTIRLRTLIYGGTWSFDSKKEDIIIQRYLGFSYSGTGAEIWHIIKLKNNQLWFTETTGNDVIEIHLSPR